MAPTFSKLNKEPASKPLAVHDMPSGAMSARGPGEAMSARGPRPQVPALNTQKVISSKAAAVDQ